MLYVGFGGYVVDVFDFMIYLFLILMLIVIWGMIKSEVGMIVISLLILLVIGGWVVGIFVDCYGCVCVL